MLASTRSIAAGKRRAITRQPGFGCARPMAFDLRQASAALMPFAVALLVPAVAHAGDQDRDYCPARPGLGTPACTMAPGQVSVETSLGDWTLDKQRGDRTDT